MANASSPQITAFVAGTVFNTTKGEAGVNEKVAQFQVVVASLADNATIGLILLKAGTIITDIRLGGDLNVDVNVGIANLARTTAIAGGVLQSDEDDIVDGLTVNTTSHSTNAMATGANALAAFNQKLWEIDGLTAQGVDLPMYELMITVEDASVADGTGTLNVLIRYIEP